jgi:hypothetical protein
LSIEEASSEKKICSAILLFIYSIEGAPEQSGVEKRRTAVLPLPQSGRQEKNEIFFFRASLLNAQRSPVLVTRKGLYFLDKNVPY